MPYSPHAGRPRVTRYRYTLHTDDGRLVKVWAKDEDQAVSRAADRLRARVVKAQEQDFAPKVWKFIKIIRTEEQPK